MKYAVIFESTSTGHSSYASDLPGCIATGKTIEQTRKRMQDAIEVHLGSMRKDGDTICVPTLVAKVMKSRTR